MNHNLKAAETRISQLECELRSANDRCACTQRVLFGHSEQIAQLCKVHGEQLLKLQAEVDRPSPPNTLDDQWARVARTNRLGLYDYFMGNL